MECWNLETPVEMLGQLRNSHVVIVTVTVVPVKVVRNKGAISAGPEFQAVEK